MTMRRNLIIVLIFLIFSNCIWSTDVGNEGFNIYLEKKSPDYFRFVDTSESVESPKEITTEGITFSLPDESLVATATVSVKYNIRSGSTLTLHRSADRQWGSTSGYMLVGEDNINSGLNYDMSYASKGNGTVTLKIPEDLSPSERNSLIDLSAYDVEIYSASPSSHNSSEGIIEFTFTMNPPQWDDGETSYLSDVYTGYLTLSLTAQ